MNESARHGMACACGALLVGVAAVAGLQPIRGFSVASAERERGVESLLAQRLNRDSPSVRLLDGRFMVINQAMGLPKGRDAALAYLDAFVEEMKASGFVAQALARHRIEGAAVATAGR